LNELVTKEDLHHEIDGLRHEIKELDATHDYQTRLNCHRWPGGIDFDLQISVATPENLLQDLWRIV